MDKKAVGKENDMVYEALKNTVLHCEDGIRNAKIYMYSVYFALLAFGFEHNWMILISFFVLIAFQTMINNDRIAIERIASYIRVFFETKRNDMHWSTINKDEEHLSIYRTQYQNIGWKLQNYGSTLLALISLISFAICTFQKYRIDSVPAIDWVGLTAAALLCCLVAYINSRGYIGSAKDKGTSKAIEKSIEDFYEKCYGTDK